MHNNERTSFSLQARRKFRRVGCRPVVQRAGGHEAEWRRVPALRTGRTHKPGWAKYLCLSYAAYVTGTDFIIDGAERYRRLLRQGEILPVREPLALREDKA